MKPETILATMAQTIGSLLVKEVFIVARLHGDLEYIQSKLESIQSLLKDADRRKEKSNSQKKTWINNVRDVAYDIEDLILEEELGGIEDNRKDLISWLKDEEPQRKELEAVAKKIAGKCEGLPLAIIAIGGMMSQKERSELEWEKVEDSLSWELSSNPYLDRMKNILLHSYYDLPYHLKNYFLYCIVIPVDYIIRKRKLIRLRIAEGFVKERRGLTNDDLAELYEGTHSLKYDSSYRGE
ncbi:hypothetical protein AAC387_Pa07g1549 [Persea americana]